MELPNQKWEDIPNRAAPRVVTFASRSRTYSATYSLLALRSSFIHRHKMIHAVNRAHDAATAAHFGSLVFRPARLPSLLVHVWGVCSQVTRGRRAEGSRGGGVGSDSEAGLAPPSNALFTAVTQEPLPRRRYDLASSHLDSARPCARVPPRDPRVWCEQAPPSLPILHTCTHGRALGRSET